MHPSFGHIRKSNNTMKSQEQDAENCGVKTAHISQTVTGRYLKAKCSLAGILKKSAATF